VCGWGQRSDAQGERSRCGFDDIESHFQYRL
jgi:hypothetical protein